MSIAGDLIRGHTDAIILARLLQGDSYGYEINKMICTLSAGRFDDLVSRGSTSENAYRQAIAGIGDISAILGEEQAAEPDYNPLPEFEGTAPAVARMMRAVAISLYIVSPVPVILLESFGWENAGICIMLVIVAIATLLLLTFGTNKKERKAAGNTESKEEKC